MRQCKVQPRLESLAVGWTVKSFPRLHHGRDQRLSFFRAAQAPLCGGQIHSGGENVGVITPDRGCEQFYAEPQEQLGLT
jgi:hypothetical protein